MINRIKTHPVLSKFIEPTCCENGVCVSFSEDLSNDDYVIIKVDKYYNSLNILARPASPDCLIIRKCVRNGYGLAIVELKNISNSHGFEVNNLKEKFETCIYDFVGNKFKNPLDDIEYKDIKLFFVSNIELYKRDLGLKMETLMNFRIKYQGKSIMINPKMPSPTISNCY